MAGRDAPDPAGNRPGTRRAFGAIAGFCGCLVLAEAASRAAFATGALYGAVDLDGTLTSEAEIEDRLRSPARGRRPLLLLGDSVLGASALLEHGVPRARRRTLAAALRAALPDRSIVVASADGLLLPDLEGIADRAARLRPPADALVVLNFRMFASAFESGPGSRSRDFLAPSDVRRREARIDEEGLSRRLEETAFRFAALFRLTRAVNASWWMPSEKDVLQRALRIAAPASEDADLAEAALRLRVRDYYAPRDWSAESEAFRSLDRLVRRLAAEGTRVRVVLAPQNPDYLAESRGTPHLAANRALLANRVRSASGTTGAFADLADRFSSGAFLDHCHLGPDGNAALARDLAALLGPPG